MLTPTEIDTYRLSHLLAEMLANEEKLITGESVVPTSSLQKIKKELHYNEPRKENDIFFMSVT